MEGSPSRKISTIKTELIPRIFHTLTEVPYGAWYLHQSFNQKDQINPQEAQDFLTATENFLSQENPYFKDQEHPVVKEHVGSGFYNSCWKFETSKGVWVIKIGHNQAPMQTDVPLSSENYTRNYRQALDTQRSIFSEQLPNLIPEPQEVLYIKGKERATTVVVQPFIRAIMPFNKIKGLDLEQQQNLKGELKIFLRLCKIMRERYGITPDLIRADSKEGHFVVAQTKDGPHLVMLDNDVFDKRSPKPLFTLLNNLAVNLKVNQAIRKIK
jgi:hypothetical protein